MLIIKVLEEIFICIFAFQFKTELDCIPPELNLYVSMGEISLKEACLQEQKLSS